MTERWKLSSLDLGDGAKGTMGGELPEASQMGHAPLGTLMSSMSTKANLYSITLQGMCLDRAILLLLFWVGLKGLIRGLWVLLLIILIFTQEVSRKDERAFSKALTWMDSKPKTTSCL